MGRSVGVWAEWILAPFNIFIIISLTACSAPGTMAPVSDVAQPPNIWLDEHIVAPGETLYSIAWRYNMDHRQLAIANGIGRDFKIYPGQRLSLNLNERSVPSRQVSEPTPQPQLASEPISPKAAPTSSRSENQTPPSKTKMTPRVSESPKSWQWPAQGKILAPFHSNGGLNKGIDIGGELGEPVLAAGSGDIVYSGAGLRGYGKLIILKHSDKYLSAYAHNSKLLVKEGEAVTAGQQIAEMGSSGTDRVKLHFEIRFDGKPVNPVDYLPKLD